MNVVPGPLPNMSLPTPAMITGASPPSFSPLGFKPIQMPTGFPPVIPVASMNPAGPPPPSVTESPTKEPSEDALDGPGSHIDQTGAQALSPPPLTGILGPRLGPLPPRPPVGLRPPFMPHFPNNGSHPRHPTQNMPPQNMPSQNMPSQNMPPQNMPSQRMPSQNMPPQRMPPRGPNPMFGEPPVGRFRMPMIRPPRHDFPPRHDHPPHRPPMGPRGEEPHWQDRFGNEPPFHRGGWSRGGPRGRSRWN